MAAIPKDHIINTITLATNANITNRGLTHSATPHGQLMCIVALMDTKHILKLATTCGSMAAQPNLAR